MMSDGGRRKRRASEISVDVGSANEKEGRIKDEPPDSIRKKQPNAIERDDEHDGEHDDENNDDKTEKDKKTRASLSRKRAREIHRREKMNEGLNLLSELLYKVEPSLYSGRDANRRSSSETAPPENILKNRSQLIECTVRVIQKLKAQNQDYRDLIANIEGGDKTAANKIRSNLDLAITTAQTGGKNELSQQQHDLALPSKEKQSEFLPYNHPESCVTTATNVRLQGRPHQIDLGTVQTPHSTLFSSPTLQQRDALLQQDGESRGDKILPTVSAPGLVSTQANDNSRLAGMMEADGLSFGISHQRTPQLPRLLGSRNRTMRLPHSGNKPLHGSIGGALTNTKSIPKPAIASALDPFAALLNASDVTTAQQLLTANIHLQQSQGGFNNIFSPFPPIDMISPSRDDQMNLSSAQRMNQTEKLLHIAQIQQSERSDTASEDRQVRPVTHASKLSFSKVEGDKMEDAKRVAKR